MRAVQPWLSVSAIVLVMACEVDPAQDGIQTAGGGGRSSGPAGGTGALTGTAGSLAVVAGRAGAGVGGAAGSQPSPAGAGVQGGAGTGGAGGRGGVAGAGNPAAGSGASSGSGSGSGTGAAGNPAAGGGGSSAGSGSGAAGSPAVGPKFSFFVTSLAGMRELSNNPQGFGGDLRYGGATTGLAGADNICSTLAEKSLAGSGAKGWRAFLSTARGGASDGPVHAKDRVGSGPWYDRNGRLVAMTLTALLQNRPMGADAAIINDLPNENGVPNRKDATPGMDDNHDTITGTNTQGMYDSEAGNTCSDWTNKTASSGQRGPRVGHSWPAQSGTSWIQAHQAPGCTPSVSLVQTGGGSGTGIGNGGGYGGFYCFALMP